MTMEKREIKFRAWHKDAEEMLLWDRLKNLRMAIESENVLLMQYTGLKDKNGKEIYEGDIVTYKGGCAGEVIYQQWVCQFILQLLEKGRPYAGWFERDYMQKDGEIIGNIYENPELLNP